MTEATTHWDFVIASYGLTALVLGGLVASIIMDQRRQRKTLADLEAAGVGRRGRKAGTETP